MSRSVLSRQSMRKSTLLLFTVMSALVARAGLSSGGDDDRPPPTPVENLYFATDEFIYVPIYTSSMGFRLLTGAKTSFSGKSLIVPSDVNIGAATGVYVLRTYADGNVGLDTRSDNNGTQMASADGYTPTFSYRYTSQESEPGYISMHSYSASVQDTNPRMRDPESMSGFEVTIARDMPNWLGKRVLLKITGGLGLNGIKSQFATAVPAIIHKTTDLYSLNGATAPGTSYTGPVVTLNNFIGPDGTPSAMTLNQFTLIGAEPSSRTVTDIASDSTVNNVYKVKGSFFTARVGPTLIFPFTEKFRASVSVGLMALYSGTTFDVEENFVPEVGSTVSNQGSVLQKKLLPGFYVDANLEYWITEKTGLYAGAAYQGGGSYTQDLLISEETKYTTKIDLKSLSGVRAGMHIRF